MFVCHAAGNQAAGIRSNCEPGGDEIYRKHFAGHDIGIGLPAMVQ